MCHDDALYKFTFYLLTYLHAAMMKAHTGDTKAQADMTDDWHRRGTRKPQPKKTIMPPQMPSADTTQTQLLDGGRGGSATVLGYGSVWVSTQQASQKWVIML